MSSDFSDIDPNLFITDDERTELRETLNAPHISRRLLPPAVRDYIERLEAYFITQYRLIEIVRRKSMDMPLKHAVGRLQHRPAGRCQSDHGNWLLCDGRKFTLEDYPELAAVLGAKDGIFSVPNCCTAHNTWWILSRSE